ncbi:H-NS histone family protein [Burkholderia oklahomensis]|uniref:H-NS histone family protein n=1 Tax=Burkholderia oklahomensis TaxID=342113 RepID=UPI0026527C25|nr:H-NS histone family protein [Burkholderia oklahomensis]MDN7675594.1 H-NS histone family protein [Burkholderia oklahomensis]
MIAYQRFKELKIELEARLADERRAVKEAVLAEIRACVDEFGFSLDDVFPPDGGHGRRKVRAKYYDPVSGATWSGVGREPVWIRGKDRAPFELRCSGGVQEPS